MAGYKIVSLKVDPPVVQRGGEANFFVEVIDAETGALVSNTLKIQLTSGKIGRAVEQAWTNMTVLRTGMLQYTFQVATTVPIGLWTVEVKTSGDEALEEWFGALRVV